jgi:hypothetical protein
MKKSFFALCFMLLFFYSCTKTSAEHALLPETATISIAKFPCGPACTAETWTLVTDNNVSYEPINLPEPYKVYHLPVKVKLKKTGTKATLWEGTGNELVEVVEIMKR